ncbi:hypothetical protein OPT61_g6548 [Boeremia exigua]|uniref:Uncharacterized protein n=1 Tax=Boeremia exigua TaxID=749465 RepID=A0ACC2I606_9PLEO|nr:hypothetical protein OPT61_g6548 [Boeremia exigua]
MCHRGNAESGAPDIIRTFGVDRLSITLSALCQTPTGALGAISEQLGGLVFEVRRGEAVQDVNECQLAFAAIISRCIETAQVSGGESRSEKGITYLMRPSTPDKHHPKHVRASVLAKPAPAKPAPAKPAPAKPAPAKPAPAKPAPVKPSPNPAKPLPSPSKSIKIGPTKDCKQLGLLMQTPATAGKLTRTIEEENGGFVGSRVDVNLKQKIAKRAADDIDDGWSEPTEQKIRKSHRETEKTGTACGIRFNALNYPKAVSMPATAPYFSIDSPDGVCETIKYQETMTAVLGVNKYHIEHILEWQTVAKFFDWIERKTKAAKKTFKNPDVSHNKAEQVDFCEYFKEHWQGSYPQELTIDGKTMTPILHMAQAYPGVGNREEEFVWLQASMNTPAKSNMWSYKGTKDDTGTLHNAETMREHITGGKTDVKGQDSGKVAGALLDKAKVALLKLKALMGARKYMRSKTVSDIFKKQKQEIGKMLTSIDNELPKHPREPTRGTRKIDAWVKQDLGKLWDEYMDERFAIAHKRTHNDMDTYLKLIDDTWCEGRPKSKPGSPAGSRPGTPAGSRPGTPAGPRPGTPFSDKIDDITKLFDALDVNDTKKKDFCQFLAKVQKEWTAEKAIPWTAPW